MPTYSYECKKCGQVQDEFHMMSATPKVVCSACGSKSMKKLLGTGSGIIFKGSGFYETDYKNGGKKAPKSDSSGSDSKGSETKTSEAGGSGSETKSSDSKSSDTKKTETKKSDTKSTPAPPKSTSAA